MTVASLYLLLFVEDHGFPIFQYQSFAFVDLCQWTNRNRHIIESDFCREYKY